MRHLLIAIGIVCSLAGVATAQSTGDDEGPTSDVVILPCVDNCPSPEPTPCCADLGCPLAPSGSPYIWEPCTRSVCYCGAPVGKACTP